MGALAKAKGPAEALIFDLEDAASPGGARASAQA
jgi:hypothetical protein